MGSFYFPARYGHLFCYLHGNIFCLNNLEPIEKKKSKHKKGVILSGNYLLGRGKFLWPEVGIVEKVIYKWKWETRFIWYWILWKKTLKNIVHWLSIFILSITFSTISNTKPHFITKYYFPSITPPHIYSRSSKSLQRLNFLYINVGFNYIRSQQTIGNR